MNRARFCLLSSSSLSLSLFWSWGHSPPFHVQCLLNSMEKVATTTKLKERELATHIRFRGLVSCFLSTINSSRGGKKKTAERSPFSMPNSALWPFHSKTCGGKGRGPCMQCDGIMDGPRAMNTLEPCVSLLSLSLEVNLKRVEMDDTNNNSA